jgi:hypothetical protein
MKMISTFRYAAGMQTAVVSVGSGAWLITNMQQMAAFRLTYLGVALSVSGKLGLHTIIAFCLPVPFPQQKPTCSPQNYNFFPLLSLPREKMAFTSINGVALITGVGSIFISPSPNWQ